MRPLLSLILLLSLTGCGNKTTQTDASDTATSVPVTRSGTAAPAARCFRQVVGRDSTTLRLLIDGQTVTGELSVLPFEKDRARGPIRGILTNNQISANWQRSGEGVTQSYEVTFTLKGDAVSWREGERVEKQGKWVLKNPDKGYEYLMIETTCP